MCVILCAFLRLIIRIRFFCSNNEGKERRKSENKRIEGDGQIVTIGKKYGKSVNRNGSHNKSSQKGKQKNLISCEKFHDV